MSSGEGRGWAYGKTRVPGSRQARVRAYLAERGPQPSTVAMIAEALSLSKYQVRTSLLDERRAGRVTLLGDGQYVMTSESVSQEYMTIAKAAAQGWWTLANAWGIRLPENPAALPSRRYEEGRLATAS